MMPLKHIMNSLNVLNSGRIVQKTNSVPSLFFATKTIAEMAGVTQAPKKPLTPYFRFLQAARPKVQSENPKMLATDVVKELAKRWENVDQQTKERYEEDYKKDREVYERQITQYKAKLTPEMMESLRMARQEKQEIKEKRLLRKKNKELDKPKKVPSAFLQFVMAERAKQASGANYQTFLKKIAGKWAQLSDAEKKPYFEKYQKEAVSYKAALEKWETKMLRDGHLDVVRSPLLLETPVKSAKSTDATPVRRSRSRKSSE